MRKLLNAAAAATVVLALAGCQNALGDARGPMTGTWKFTMTGFQQSPVDSTITCNMETTYVVRQEGGQLEGRGSGGNVICYRGQTSLGGTYWEGGVVRGEVENGHVHTSDAGNFHCFAELHPTRMEGYLESYGGWANEPSRTVRSGTCVLEKISDVGYDGPRA
ncbi:MAG TPA: hypothetical protein VFJ16_25595 [Longimicrobium sp.]|nr:hypothetical protein [Longimicrobium sp.]